ncbi:hypothetical protein [cyanobacterium endosymbiont of Rhopalodia gibberula]|nr:hypothetical protein [cyanobacterium endosymbiont of Rhopalodia gibberula]
MNKIKIDDTGFGWNGSKYKLVTPISRRFPEAGNLELCLYA